MVESWPEARGPYRPLCPAPLRELLPAAPGLGGHMAVGCGVPCKGSTHPCPRPPAQLPAAWGRGLWGTRSPAAPTWEISFLIPEARLFLGGLARFLGGGGGAVNVRGRPAYGVCPRRGQCLVTVACAPGRTAPGWSSEHQATCTLAHRSAGVTLGDGLSAPLFRAPSPYSASCGIPCPKPCGQTAGSKSAPGHQAGVGTPGAISAWLAPQAG